LLVNYRPEYQHRWGNKPYYTQLRLDRLHRQNVEQLLQSLIGLDASTRSLWQLLVDKTEGNPFFLEESVRTLAEAGVLVGERGAYRLARASSRIDIPATVQAVLAARIDRLPSSEKRLLQSASVIGKDVPLPLLRAVSELPEDMLLAAIQHLQAGEFIFELRLFPEAEYSFTHALTQGVAYASVLQDRRRDVHAAIVEAMERLYPNPLFEQVEQLAHHAFCGELWKKAADYSRYAGTHAYARSALQQAVTLFEQALAALVHLPDNRARTEQAIELHLQTRHALLLLGDIPKILPHLLEAETLAELLVERRRLGHVLSNMTQYFCITGNLPRGIETGHRAIIIARAHDDLPLRITTMFHLGLGYYGLGDYIRASTLFSEHLETLSGDLVRERFGMAGFPSVFCRAYLALCRADMGAFVDALAVAEEAVRIAELLDQPYSLSIARSYLGETWLLKGDLPKAFAVLEQALQLCNDRSILGVLPTAGSDLGYAYALSGRLCEALPLLEQAAEHTLATGPQGHSRRLTLLGDAYLRAGRSQEALKAACRALTIARQEKRRANEAWTFRLLGEIDSLGDSGDLEKSETRYRDAMALATELDMRPLVAHCHLGLGKLHRRAGKRPALEEHLSVAATMYRDMDMRFWQEQAEAETGSRSTESQRVP
jgi:tetratricopeptide (TPR) repeat protein